MIPAVIVRINARLDSFIMFLVFQVVPAVYTQDSITNNPMHVALWYHSDGRDERAY